MSFFDKLTMFMTNKAESDLAYFLANIEAKSGVKKEYVIFAIGGLFATILIMGGDKAGVLCHLIGILYPAYRTVKVFQANTGVSGREEIMHWMFYWLAFAFLGLLDFACRQLPLYWLLKSILLIYLFSPITEGKAMGFNLIMKVSNKYRPSSDTQLERHNTQGPTPQTSEEFAQKYSAAIDRVGSLREISPQNIEQTDSADGSSSISPNSGRKSMHLDNSARQSALITLTPTVKRRNDIVNNYDENCDMVGSLRQGNGAAVLTSDSSSSSIFENIEPF